ncbi:hypothetical protein I203_106196 [Kwoniella mangroviensis CBS 8507]|uniref:uncharacterized protein n=1 Tax=Kwoniella mangroviensis CBS 8507 TaxID=1296122 RepID=UPI00080D050B|nr:uncharacterized protein I203_04670 [Kwoniella mangroviensis CBS 8507]OCF66339.1 hypothetical protein I203_04670 [Kwoniella mangroviensis CBS 8507]
MSVNPPSNAISTKRKPMDHPNSDRPEKTHKANTAPPVPLDSRPPSDLQESPRWHPYHSDGNVILRADDGTLFGADSWRLAKASTVFKDMFDIPQPISFGYPKASRWVNQDQPIDKQVTSFILETFLNLINVSIPSLSNGLSFAQMTALSGLCDKFIVTKNIVAQVSRGLLLAGANDPWDLLVWASKKDFLSMGRKALSYMGPEGFTKVYPSPPVLNGRSSDDTTLKYKPFWDRFHLLSPSWQIALISTAFPQPTFRPAENSNTASKTKKISKNSPKGKTQGVPSYDTGPAKSGTFEMVMASWDEMVKGFNPQS